MVSERRREKPAPLRHLAADPRHSRGRRLAEPTDPGRNDFQRDRDRIVHSTAFRRLVYKTQVFLNHEGDLFRTRLTHSLEVAQIGRSIARSLGLHEDLVEAIALAHDLGHTPFGHAGQDALHACMTGHGGFEHNLQSLRVVDVLEQRYPAFDGLNLCFETRAGILKHCSRHQARYMEQFEPEGVAARFLHRGQPTLEAQLCNLADEIAYNAHDVDDGIRSGLIELDRLLSLELIATHHEAALREWPQLAAAPVRRRVAETLRRLLSAQVHDVIAASQAAVREAAVSTAAEVQAHPRPLITFSEPMRRQSTELKRFLFRHLYRHPQVVATTERARQVVSDLVAAYVDHPPELPAEYAASPLRHRAVADYVAGMTDRFALREHHRLTGQRLFP